MKNIIKYSIAAVAVVALFNGCGNTQPQIVTIKERKTTVVEPEASQYTYVKTPSFEGDIDSMDTEEALDAVTNYSIKLQSVIQKYEARVDSLKTYYEEVKQKYKESDEEVNKK